MYSEIVTSSQHRDRILRVLGSFLLLLYAALIFVGYKHYSVGHLFWFCDVALLLTGIGLFVKNSALITAQLTAVFCFHLAWNISFWMEFFWGRSFTGATDYMFCPGISVLEKTMSAASHMFVVPVALIGVLLLGPPRWAWLLQWGQTILVFLASYFFTRPDDNVNWMFGSDFFGVSPVRIGPGLYYCLMALAPPLLIYWPTNQLLKHADGLFEKMRAVLLARLRSVGQVRRLNSYGAYVGSSSIACLAFSFALAVSAVADQQYSVRPALLQSDLRGNTPLELMPEEIIKSRVISIQFGDGMEARVAPLLVWRAEIPKQWSGSNARIHPHTKAILQHLRAEEIPSVPQEVIVQGTRAIPGSAVWAYVVSDNFYLQPGPDLRGGRRFHVRFQIGNHGIAEFVDPHTGGLYASTPYNEILGLGTGAIYVLGVIEVAGGKIVSRSPYYLVKRRGIRFPQDVWFTVKEGTLVPMLSDFSKPSAAKIAFQSSPDPAHVPTDVFLGDFFAFRIRPLTRDPSYFSGFLGPDGRPCDGVGWITDKRIRYCKSKNNGPVSCAVADDN